MTQSTPRKAIGDLLRHVLASIHEVSLIDRLIGRPHAVAVIPLAVAACDPRLTRAQIMHHRATQHTDAAMRPIHRQGVL